MNIVLSLSLSQESCASSFLLPRCCVIVKWLVFFLVLLNVQKMTVMQYFVLGKYLTPIHMWVQLCVWVCLSHYYILYCRCCDYALLILEYWADEPEIQRSADLYEELIRCCVGDAMSEVVIYCIL